jgi:hypothetical protein
MDFYYSAMHAYLSVAHNKYMLCAPQKNAECPSKYGFFGIR